MSAVHMCLLCMLQGRASLLAHLVLVKRTPLRQLTQQVFHCKEELSRFGPLYGNLERIPAGFIIIMQDDTPDVLIGDM